MFTDITTPIITPQPIFIIIICYILLQRKGFSVVFINSIRKVMHVGQPTTLYYIIQTY